MFHSPSETNDQKSAAGEACRVVYISPLKALAVDVERNLRTPLESIASLARNAGLTFRPPEIAIRTGDTPQTDRARFRRHPADILITTPESLYLLLTSESASALRTVDTVIVDEIHAIVPTKRGAHLALSLERLEALAVRPIQRIGLSATQRPLEEVAFFLVGTSYPGRAREVAESKDRHRAGSPLLLDPVVTIPRPVTIINASEPKRLQLKVEVPIEDFSTTFPPLINDPVPRVPGVGDTGIRAQARPPLGTPNAERRGWPTTQTRFHLDHHPAPHPRHHPRAQIHPHLRQQPPHCRTSRRPYQ
jgi:ATP-dependent Lhr-like helicase